MAQRQPASSAENADPTTQQKLPLALLSPVHWPAWLGVGLFYLLSLLPLAWLDRLGRRLGAWSARHHRKRHHIALTNLKRCFPTLSEQQAEEMASSHFEYLVTGFLHYALLWWRPVERLDQYAQIDGREHIEKAHAEGRQVIVLLSHCPGLEFAAAALAKAYPSSAPYKPFDHPVVDWLIARGRSRYNDFRLFPRDAGLRTIVREVREGRLLVYLADENLGPEVSVFSEFFGQQKASIPMLGRLARACDAVVLPAISCYDWQQRRYSVKLLPALQDFPSGEVTDDTLRMNQAIEATVNTCPVQYFWTLKLFKTRPPGAEKIY